jgi:hypothetical protein
MCLNISHGTEASVTALPVYMGVSRGGRIQILRAKRLNSIKVLLNNMNSSSIDYSSLKDFGNSWISKLILKR